MVVLNTKKLKYGTVAKRFWSSVKQSAACIRAAGSFCVIQLYSQD